MNIIHLLYMDKPNNQNYINIKNIYDNLNYFDQYGSSLVLFILITIALFILCSYCFVMINVQPIKDDWINQRCKPSIIPFAGLINAPEGMSSTDFTKENFDYCTQNIVKGVTGPAVQPLTFITSMLNSIFDNIKQSLNGIREMINKVRTNIQATVEEIMGRIINVTIPLQQIIIGLRDILSKVQGTMTAGLFTLLGSYYTLKSLMGSIAQLIITILVALAAMIAALWVVPFTWGAAAANTAIFVAISIPMALILTFMTKVLKVQTNLKIPKVKCFDKNTLLKMNDGSEKPISEINVGNRLFNDNQVTAKIKVTTEGSEMYNLNGVIVSDSHIVKYNDKWLPVSDHPDSIKIENYNEPFLYCLNTNSKTIIINDICFTDWDEIYDNDIAKFNDLLSIKFKNDKQKYMFQTRDIHRYFDGGIEKNTLIKLKNGSTEQIKNIKIDDILENGEKVYGLVEIFGITIDEQFIYYLGKNRLVQGGCNLCFHNESTSSILSTLDLDIYNQELCRNESVLYHLLTDKGTFKVEDVIFYDYNASIDLFLDKSKLLSMKYV
jgi:hypothetical protein